MDNSKPSFASLAAKTMVCHTITYMFMGALAAHFLNYAELLARPDSGMRHITDPLVIAGGLFQPLRGLVFALVFYPLRDSLFGRKNGWLIMSWMLIGLGILATFGPVQGSMEGMIYTTAPIRQQLTGWLEIVPQAILLSALLCYWVNHPEKKWLNWLLGIILFVVMALPVLGLMVHKP